MVQTRLAATLARMDLAAQTANLLPGVEAVLSARERGVNPPRTRLVLGDGAELTADHVGLRLAWSPASGLAAEVSAPNLQLNTSGVTLPMALPVIAADGSVTLPPAGVGRRGGARRLLGRVDRRLSRRRGAGAGLAQRRSASRWRPARVRPPAPGRPGGFDPRPALRDWLPRLAMSELGPPALSLVADLFAGAGASRGFIEGTGHPDDPYRLAIDAGLPNIAVWFPPQGLEPALVGAPPALQSWRPGQPGLAPAALKAALQAEAGVAGDVRALVEGRDIEAGLVALTQRWIGGDGRIVAATGGTRGCRRYVAAAWPLPSSSNSSTSRT